MLVTVPWKSVWGFDCGKAALPTDYVVCSTPELRAANEAVASSWVAARQRLNEADKLALVTNQKDWLRETIAACGLSDKGKPTDAVINQAQNCVLWSHRERAKYLEGIAKARQPPPIPSELPKVRGSYLAAREKLVELGFKPATIRNENLSTRICADEKYEKCMAVREAECAVDAGACIVFWKNREGVPLKINLEGEIDPVIDYMNWASESEFQEFEGGN